MGYGKRIDTLCSHLRKVESFADVGCDHGYCTEYMLQKGLCKKAIFSDISKGSLAKAEKLLAPYVEAGKAHSVLGNGFYGVPAGTEQVLIAGMGGSEMVSILSDKAYGFLPKYFVLQPMHDSEKLRRYLVEQGGILERDYTFFDGKYYDVLVGYNGKMLGEEAQAYTDAAYAFGKENLEKMPDAFVARTKKQIANIQKYLVKAGLQEESKQELIGRQRRLEGVLSGEIR